MKSVNNPKQFFFVSFRTALAFFAAKGTHEVILAVKKAIEALISFDK